MECKFVSIHLLVDYASEAVWMLKSLKINTLCPFWLYLLSNFRRSKIIDYGPFKTTFRTLNLLTKRRLQAF